MHKFLIHDGQDNVGVAVADIAAGEPVTGVCLTDGRVVEVVAAEPVPLGHKVALVPLAPGDRVVKYGYPVGVVTRPIAAGAHVHVHNVKSLRWRSDGHGA